MACELLFFFVLLCFVFKVNDFKAGLGNIRKGRKNAKKGKKHIMEKTGNNGDKQKLKYQFQKYPEKKNAFPFLLS